MRRCLAWLAALLLLCGCAARPADGTPAADAQPYQAPPFHGAAFHADAAEDCGGVLLDLSCTADGYVAVSAESSRRLKFQVCKGDQVYNYDLASDGTPSIYPLQCGSGSYRFRVMENVSGSRYAERLAADCEVRLSDEFQPFLRPSDYVPYTADAACVRRAAELARDAHTALDVVRAVYDCICSSVDYDADKARSAAPGYLPDPDETLQSGKGICFDYAALAAAMLRSQGIPTKVIFGFVAPEGLYHAWNMFYTDETGWVTVSYEADGAAWNRLDLTFEANGGEDFAAGTSYTDLYVY